MQYYSGKSSTYIGEKHFLYTHGLVLSPCKVFVGKRYHSKTHGKKGQQQKITVYILTHVCVFVCVCACWHRRGDAWKTWNKAILTELLSFHHPPGRYKLFFFDFVCPTPTVQLGWPYVANVSTYISCKEHMFVFYGSNVFFMFDRGKQPNKQKVQL